MRTPLSRRERGPGGEDPSPAPSHSDNRTTHARARARAARRACVLRNRRTAPAHMRAHAHNRRRAFMNLDRFLMWTLARRSDTPCRARTFARRSLNGGTAHVQEVRRLARAASSAKSLDRSARYPPRCRLDARCFPQRSQLTCSRHELVGPEQGSSGATRRLIGAKWTLVGAPWTSIGPPLSFTIVRCSSFLRLSISGWPIRRI